MPAEVGPVTITYVANLREALSSLRTFGSSVKEIGQSTRESLAGIAESIGVLENIGTVIGGAVALKSFASFDKAVTNVRATLRQTEQEFAGIRGSILELSSSFTVSANAVADGYNRVAKAGYTAADSQLVLTAAIKASKATGTDIAATTGVLAQTLKTYGLNAAEAAEVTGKLVAASQQGAFTFGDLAGAIGSLGPSAARLGIDLNSLLATLSSLSREQGNVEQVGLQLRSLFSQLLNPSAQLEAVFLKYLGTTARASIETRGFAATIQALTEAAARGDIALEDVFPNARELGAVLRIAGDGAKSLNQDLNRIKGSGAKSLEEAVRIQSESLGDLIEDIERFPANLVNQVFNDNRTAIIAAVTAVRDFAEANRNALLSVTAVAAALPVIGTGLLAIKFSASTVVSLYDGLKQVFSLFGAGASAVAGFAAESGKVTASLQAQLQAVNALVPLRVQDIGVLNAWQEGLRASAEAQNALDLATLRQAETQAALTLAQQEALAVNQAATAAKLKSITIAEAAVAAALEEVEVARIAAATDATKDEARIAASVKLIAAEEALAAAKARSTVVTAEQTVAEARLTAAQQAHAVATAQVTAAATAQSAATATAATSTAAATAASVTLGGTLRGLFPTFAGIGASLSNLPGLIATAAGAARGFAANLTSVAGVLGLLRTGLAFAAGGVVSLASGLFSIATGVVGVLAAKLALIAAVGYSVFKLGRELKFLVSGNVRQEEIDAIEKRGAEIAARFAADRNQQLARRAADAASVATDLKRVYGEIAEQSRRAGEGDTAAAARLKELRQEAERLEQLNPFDKLKASASQYAQVVGQSVLAAQKLGVEGAKDIQVQRDAYGRIVAVIGDYREVLTRLGERLAKNNEEANKQGGGVVRSAEEARAAADGYEQQKVALSDLQQEQQKAGLATKDLASAQSQLNLAVGSANETVKAYRDTVQRIATAQLKSALTDELRTVFDLTEEYQSLTGVLEALIAKRRELVAAQAAAGGKDANPAADKAIADLDTQIRNTSNIRRETERRTDEAIAKSREEATRRVEDAEIAALQARGQFEEAEQRKAEVNRNRALAQIEATIAAERRGRDVLLRQAEDQFAADKKRIDLSTDPQSVKNAALADAQKEYERRVKLVKQLEAESLARYPREKEAVRDLYQGELDQITKNSRQRFESTDEGRRAADAEARAKRSAESLAEAAAIRLQVLDAQKRNDLRSELDLREQLVGKLREANDITAANLEREQGIRRTVRERVGLLRDELQTRFRISGLRGDFAQAARSAQQDLAGSSDAAGFRQGVRSRFRDDPTANAIEERRRAILEALQREQQALEVTRSQLSRQDADYTRKAAEIAEKQREVLEKLRVLNEEAEKAKREAANQRNIPAVAPAVVTAPASAPAAAPAPAAQPAARPAQSPPPSDAPRSITSPNVVPLPDRKRPGPAAPPTQPAQPAQPAPAAPAPAPQPTPPARLKRPSVKVRPYPGYVETGRYKCKDLYGGPDRTIIIFTSLTTGAVQYIDEEDLIVDPPANAPAPTPPAAPPAGQPAVPVPGNAPTPGSTPAPGTPGGPGGPEGPPVPSGDVNGIATNLKDINTAAASLSSSTQGLVKSVDAFAGIVVKGFKATDEALKVVARRLDKTAEAVNEVAGSIEKTKQDQQNARMGGS